MAAAPNPTEAFSATPLSDLLRRWQRLELLPCRSIEILLPGFTVADLVPSRAGRIIASRWTVGQDIPCG